MSPHVGNFVQDLVEMAKAMEALPKVQEALDNANSTIELYAKQVQEREIAIIDYKKEIERHLSTIRTLEVARDDAELRFLEVEDASSKVTNSLRAMAASMGSCIDMLELPKPQPTALPYTDTATAELAEDRDEPVSWDQPEPRAYIDSANWTEGQSTITIEPHPFEEHGGGMSQPIGQNAPHWSEPVDIVAGQSEADPTAMATGTGSEIAPTQNAESSANADTVIPPNPSPGPYFGKLYREVPGLITLGDWLDGDGTKDDYHF